MQFWPLSTSGLIVLHAPSYTAAENVFLNKKKKNKQKKTENKNELGKS